MTYRTDYHTGCQHKAAQWKHDWQHEEEDERKCLSLCSTLAEDSMPALQSVQKAGRDTLTSRTNAHRCAKHLSSQTFWWKSLLPLIWLLSVPEVLPSSAKIQSRRRCDTEITDRRPCSAYHRGISLLSTMEKKKSRSTCQPVSHK